MRASLLVPLLALLLAPVRGQEEPPSPSAGGVHQPHDGPPPSSGGDEEEEPDGPNLSIPPWLGGPTKAAMEDAIATWKGAYKRYKKEYDKALPDVKTAIEKLQGARKLDEQCVLPDYYLGIAYQLTQEYPLAIERLEAAVKRNSKFHEAHVELGDAYRWAGRDKDAGPSYDKAIAAAPDYAHGYYMRALLRVTAQDFEGARADLKKGLELKPKRLDYALAEKQLALVLDGPPWEKKFEVESKNYIVRTNVSQDFCDKVSKHAELIHRLYENLFPKSKAKRKSPIIVWKDAQEYRANGGPQGAGGHFDPQWKQLFLFKYAKESDTLLVLYHEGFHQFLDGVLETKPPQWFNEGLADYFGPSVYYKEKGDEGMKVRPNPWRLSLIQRMLRDGAAVSWEELMNMSQAEMYNQQSVGNHYAQAWSIVYFLAEADDRAHFHYLKDYFSALRKGKNQAEAYKAAFGKTDMVALEGRWRDFMLGVKD